MPLVFKKTPKNKLWCFFVVCFHLGLAKNVLMCTMKKRKEWRMFQFVLHNKENILFLTSASGCLFFALWFVFFVLYLKKKKIVKRLEKEATEYSVWKDFKEDETSVFKETISDLAGEKLELLKENERLKSDMEAHEKYLKEQLEFLKQNKEELTLKFQNISNEVIKAQNAAFNENQKTTMNFLLKPFAEELSEFKKKMDANHDDSIKFDEQIKNLFNLNQSLSKEAENLANALKGNKKIQGNWGEFQLERVLEISGLQKGINYFCQETIEGEDDKKLRPDVIVQLPDNRQVIIDSKVSLNDYVTYVNAENETERTEALKRHINCIRKHVQTLSSKEYQKFLKNKSLDYVMIFIPIEGAYVEVVRHDSDLYDFAFERNIAITTPSSLLPLLKTIESLWQLDKQNKNAAEIARIGGKLYDKLAGFAADMQQIEKSFKATNKHYENAMKKLQGQGGAVALAEDLKTMGAKTSKQIVMKNDEDNLIEFDERITNE